MYEETHAVVLRVTFNILPVVISEEVRQVERGMQPRMRVQNQFTPCAGDRRWIRYMQVFISGATVIGKGRQL